MPELPEVETIARTLSPQVVKQTVVATRVFYPATVEGFAPLHNLEGAEIVGVGRRGKLLLLQTTHQRKTECTGLALHLRMTGRVFVYPQNAEPNPHTRLILTLQGSLGCRQLFFDDARKFGRARLLTPQNLTHWNFWQTLGPEPLEMTAEMFTKRFTERRRTVKSLLLDQQIVAGIGNIYADESLFRARIHPATQAHHVSLKQLHTLFAHLQDVLLEAIAACGSSIKDYRTARGDAGSFQNAFNVYGRAQQPCLICHTTLQSTRIGGRTTVFCPRCQPITD